MIREVKPEHLQRGMVLALPMGKTATIADVPVVGRRYVSFTTEHGPTRLEIGQPALVDVPTNETVNDRIPECPACGAAPGQTMDPVCPVGRLLTQTEARAEAHKLIRAGVPALAGPVPLGSWGGAEEGWTVYLYDEGPEGL